METCQSAAPRHYGTDEDVVKRLREIHFSVLSSENFIWMWRVEQWWTERLLSLSYLLSGRVGPSVWWMCSSSLSAGRERSYKDGEWKWAAVIVEVAALITVYLTAVLSGSTLASLWETLQETDVPRKLDQPVSVGVHPPTSRQPTDHFLFKFCVSAV